MSAICDKRLEQAAADPAQRRAAIADFTRQRFVLFCCALVLTVGAVAMRFTPTRSPHTAQLIAIGAVLLWIVVFRVVAHLRALTEMDRGNKTPDAKPTA